MFLDRQSIIAWTSREYLMFNDCMSIVDVEILLAKFVVTA